MNNGLKNGRFVEAEARSSTEERAQQSLRPQTFQQYIGQPTLVEKLSIAVDAAIKLRHPVPHVLLHGPPGLGKTTLAHVLANEIGSKAHLTSGPALAKGPDVVGLLMQLGRGDVLFIDEIHRLPMVVEEFIYSAMEDFRVDIVVAAGMQARAQSIPIMPFTLIGATTRSGSISAPLNARFAINARMEFYGLNELTTILIHSARKLGIPAQNDDLAAIAGRSRGTPRLANRLLMRVRDYAIARGSGIIDEQAINGALDLEGVDHAGLDEQDRKFLLTIINIYGGGPVGLAPVAAAMGEEPETLAERIEPYLLRTGFVARTQRGRCVTLEAYEHLGIVPPMVTT